VALGRFDVVAHTGTRELVPGRHVVAVVGGSNVSELLCAPAAGANATAALPISPNPNTMTTIARRTTLTFW
jgi:hypothetical protein